MPTNFGVTPENLLRQEVLDLKAYPVPDSAGMVKLDAMENPYPLPQSLREEIACLVADAAINRYPDADTQRLKTCIRAVIGLPQDWDILLGNGSDEIIQLLALAVARPNATLLSVEPSFVMYKMIATFTGMQYVGVPLTEDFALDLPAMMTAIQRHQPALIFLSYPNNPTGNLFDVEAIAQIIEAAPGLVVVDEAYYAFTNASFMSMLARYPNLLVMRTFSKLGMAGLRLGFMVGSKAWLAQLEKLRLPYNVSLLTQQVAERLLQHHDVLLRQAEQIKQDRAWLYERLVGVADVRPYVSDANFILFRVMHAEKVFQGLKNRGVLIKNLSKSHPLLVDCLRVTVGTPQENEQFIRALQESIHQFV
ncbi:Histidinol-phosphate aminotransferase 1 [Candidatus Nitrotoga sp. HW29]|uniref:histidinol-phosphate transaminase n=1 Tax=Candidatus Nitrotoga sp. HW29 TaxID=2886963 RepID=UPI001EF29938|nr:histidinol-phosphate transaminase [Candidatus Nitrotoga sp. HW29]CAH1906497.1 Histidinol-phosphate aminotransferase 1 [Candidatus Nitrotoga sp. HW29]